MADSGGDDGYSSDSDLDLSTTTQSLPVLAPGPAPSGSHQALQHKPKGKQPQRKDSNKDNPDKEPRKRSSKACDNCRKSKCKCTRILDPASGEPVGPCQNCLTVGADCTFLGASRKRGPPKGYIEAIESRLHRMEALLGGLIGSDDPRAATLLGELIGDHEARDVLTRDLRNATGASTSTSAPSGSCSAQPRRSWQREFAEQQAALSRSPPAGQQPPPGSTMLSTGFPTLPGELAFPGGLGSASLGAGPSGGGAEPGTWLSDEDLAAFGAGATPGGGAGGALGFDPPGVGTYRQPGAMGQAGESSEDGASPAFAARLSTSADVSTSPRQRRRLDLPVGGGPPSYGASPGAASGTSGTSPGGGGGGGQGYGADRKQMAYAFTLPPVGVVPARSAAQTVAPVLSPGAIGHTGTSSYLLASSPGGSGGAAVGGADDDNEDRKGGGGGGGGAGGAGRARVTQSPSEPLTELADVVGQLSLNENAEVRYHGRSSGLYLIAKSQRFKEFFWRFPSAGVWPPADHGAVKTEAEILRLVGAEDALPDMETQSQLLSAYWAYVHPHFPVLYKISFMRQYRHTLAHPDSTEPSTPAGTGKVPVVLLLAMFALAARYCDLDRPTEPGKYWEAGQEYLDKARRILNHDYGSSKLVTVQALLLLSYREIGVGAMSSSWMLGGMAIRMAQDLGLFRDVEKWYLPIQRFTHEEKQARKRVWWACVILDRYTSSYIGRPGTIHERDYDCGFPSEDEPDEHEQWRPIRLDGTEWTAPPNVNRTHPGSGETVAEDNAKFLKAYPPTRAHTLSCFNAAGALAVIINRIISNIYAIRIRVLGQSSETLLSLLDQSLASWYLALPPHLQYNPASSKVPPPHILSLHLQFYSSLILLHRPFIPGQNSSASPGSFPSHSICTTSANAIANIITTWSQTFTLRQCPPFLTYPIFSAAIICVYNASFDEALARPAKAHLLQCMNALKEMELIWGSAIRQWELLHGLVDLRDADLRAELDERSQRGTKRATMDLDEAGVLGAHGAASGTAAFDGVRPTNFHHRPIQSTAAGAPTSRGATSKSGTRKRSSTSASRRSGTSATGASGASVGSATSPPLPQGQMPLFPGPAALQSPPLNLFGSGSGATPPMFQSSSSGTAQPMQGIQSHGHAPGDATPQSFDILNPQLDLSQFKSPPGSSGGGATNFSDLLNSFLSPTEAAGAGGFGTNSNVGGNAFIFGAGSTSPFHLPGSASATPAPSAAMPGAPPLPPLQHMGPPVSAFEPTSAFFGMPLGANLGDDWFNYTYGAFAAAGSDQGGTPESQAGASSGGPSAGVGGAGAGAAGAGAPGAGAGAGGGGAGGSTIASLLHSSPK